MNKSKINYRCLFNHDGFCIYSNASRYQDINQPVGLDQVYGYVDEVADAGCDVVMLCPTLYQLPGWDSDHEPFWRGEGRTRSFPTETAVGKVLSRARQFICSGNDLIQLSRDRARQKNIAFFLTWRMNESHGVDDPTSPGLSDFWRRHPEYQIGGDGPGWESHALCFLHQAVRDYQFGFIEELCSRYDIDGLELDCLRFEYYFPRSIPFSEKAPILTNYIRRIRRMLDRLGKPIPICIRVPNRMDFVRDMGLDLKACVDEGLVDMINVSPHYVTQPDGDIEGFRKAYPDSRIYGEMTHCMQRGRGIELSADQTRKTTREMFYALAQSFLARGADGISLFNFVYTRDYGFGHPLKLDREEPDFEAIRHITDRDFLARQNKHYFVGVNRTFRPWSKQLPAELTFDKPVGIKIHVADEQPQNSFCQAIFRLQSSTDIESRKVTAYSDGQALEGTFHEGELFPLPYRECVPETHGCYKDFLIPLDRIAQGWNRFELRLPDGDPCNVVRVELALYKQ